MRYTGSTLMVVVLLSGSLAGQEKDKDKSAPTYEAVADSTWIRVRSTATGVEAQFPKRPDYSDKALKFTYRDPDNETTFEVVCVPLGNIVKEREGDKQKLDELYSVLVKAMVSHGEGKLVDTRDLTHDGRTARRVNWTYSPKGGPWKGTALLVAAGDTVYVASVTRPSATPVPDKTLEQFIASVRPLAKAAKAAEPKKEVVDLTAIKASLEGKWQGVRYLGSYLLPNKDRVGSEHWTFLADGTYSHTYVPQLGARRETKGTWQVTGKHALALVATGADGKPAKLERDFVFMDGFLIINHFGTGEFSQLSVVGGGPKAGDKDTPPKKNVEKAPPVPKNADFDDAMKLMLGQGVKRDMSAAFKKFKAAADVGHPPAQFYLAAYYLEAFGVVPVDRKAAVAWLDKAAEQRYPPALCVLGAAYLEPWTGIKKDVQKGTRLLDQGAANVKDMADQGDLTALMTLDDIYNSGRGLPANPTEGMRIVRQAAAKGHPIAQLALAKSFFVIDRDFAKSKPAFEELAEIGCATAQTFLAGHYLNGRGVPRDAALAKTWLERAGAQGETAALVLLRGEVADVISRHHNRLEKIPTAEQQKLEDKIANLATIRDRVYLDLLASNRIRRPALEKTIPFGDDDLETRNDAVVEMMAELRVLSAAFTRVLDRSSPLVQGVGNRAGYLTGMEQVYDVSVAHVYTAFQVQMLVGRRVWDELSKDEKAACEKYQVRFAREVSGANAKELARLGESIAKTPKDSSLYLERARLHELRYDYQSMAADLGAAARQKDEHSAYANYLLGCHYETYGLPHKAMDGYEKALAGKHDTRIDYERARQYLRR